MSDADRLHQLQSEFEAVLEDRITHLLGHVKAAQEVTARLAATQAEIARQEQLQASLQAEADKLGEHGDKLSSDNDKLRKRIDTLKGNIRQMRSKRQELMGQAKKLSAEAKRSGES